MTTKQEQAAERAWRRTLQEHAELRFRNAIGQPPGVRSAPDSGGLCVEIEGPDGEWRRYYVRLTEVAQ